MKGLVLKDLYVLIRQFKIIILSILILTIFSGSSMILLSTFLGAYLPVVAIAYDERSDWNNLAISFPISRKDLVISKYILGYICVILSAVLSFIGAIISNVILESPMDMEYRLFSAALGLVFLAFSLFIMLSFGSEKGRILSVIVMAIASGVSSYLKVETSIIPEINIIFLLIIAVILNVLSMIFSIKIQEKKTA